MAPKKHILIVAGGGGKRMGTKLPKQFLLLNGEPILFHTFNSFLFLDDVEFTLVLSADYISYWKKLCISMGFNVPHKIVEGGPTRFHSVVSGLKNISPESLVLIHDAVRPFASQETINRVLELASRKGNAIPAISVTDSLREVQGSYNKTIARDRIKTIQTPQAFNSSIIISAYKQTYNPLFTDDASVLEATGEKINIVDGNKENIKISNAIDLIFAECILKEIKRTPLKLS